jgi:glycosyltransferase involved in cell wall biosynthesis
VRLVYIAPFGLRQKSTVWARILPLARRMAAQGAQVTILIPPWDSRQDANQRWMDEGVEIVNVRLDGGLPSTLSRLLRELALRKPSIVHIIKPRAYAGLVQYLLWQRRVAGLEGTPLLLDIDDWEQAWANVNNYARPLAHALAWQEEWGIRHTDGITAASHWLTTRASDYTQTTPILYLPNGVEIPEEPLAAPVAALPLRPPTLLYFTRYVETTPAWLADFGASLATLAPRARLIIAGQPLQRNADASFRIALTTRLAALGTPNALEVHWLGGVARDSLPGIYAASDVAIFPAQPTPLQEAKCSVRLATSLLRGVPVVASAVGEQAHYGADGAALLLPHQAPASEFAAAALRLAQDRAAAQRMVAAAHTHLTRHYQWDHLAARLGDFYQQFL